MVFNAQERTEVVISEVSDMADIEDIINFGEEVECGRIEREEKIKSRNRINMTFIRK